MAGDVITTGESVRAGRTLDSLLGRLATTAAAIDQAWSDGARRVDELQRQAELVRDEVRARTAQLEAEQATVVLELAQSWPVEDLAARLGISAGQVRDLIKDAEDHMSTLPTPRPAG